MTNFKHTVTESQASMRVDKLLVQLNEGVSRSQIQTWIDEQLVLVNNTTVKSNFKCSTGDVIVWSIPEVKPLELIAENIPLDIIYEDSDLIVVNKPKGMVVHPSAGHQSGTLVHALLYHCKDLSGINGIERPGIVHRIDKDTSGLIVAAKNDKTHVHLSDQLAEKKVTRKYDAIVHGTIPHQTGVIDAPIGRDPKDRKKMAVVDHGKSAVTHFNILKRYTDYTHIECELETGRTHQIRVHMKYIEYPLVGDPKYGPRKTFDMNGQALHAKLLGFFHPGTGKWMEFQVQVPKIFDELLNKLVKNS